MMRRFSRRRRGGGRSGGGATPIDAGAALERIRESQVVPAASLEAYDADEVPADFAAVGSGESASGGRIVVTFSPSDASHALTAALAVGGRLAEAESFDGDVYAVAPEWGVGARSVLGLVGRVPFRLSAVAAPTLGEDAGRVSPELRVDGAVLSPAQIAGHLAGPADRELFLRAARGLEGLAAKHGGALRGHGRSVEFVLLARRVAELRAEDGNVSLTALVPQRSTTRLAPDSLSSSLDALEGQLRKRLNDRRIRDGEEGLRARAITAFRAWHSLRALVPWPLGGGDPEVIDWVGVDVEGRPVIGAVREELGLEQVAAVVESALQLQGSLPTVLAQAPAPVVFDAPRLVLGGRSIALGVGRVLDALTLAHELFEVRGSGELELRAVGAGEAAAVERRPSGGRRGRPRPSEGPVGEPDDAESDGQDDEQSEGSVEARSEREEGRSGRGRGRRTRGRGRRGGRGRGAAGEGGGDAASSDDDDGSDDDSRSSRFEEVSLFDLDDEPGDSGGGRGRRRRRGRRRPRGGSGDEGGGSGDESAPAAGADDPGADEDRSERRRGPTPSATAEPDDGDEDDLIADDDGDELELEEVPEFEAPSASYEDDEEIGDDSEKRPARRARRAEAQEAAAEQPLLPRKRSAIVAHADRDSIVAAILIARDVRTLEGLWIYSQDELMSFFRGVATDLRDDTPIYVVGFRPKPAIDVLQSAALYRDRLQWFDHQDWPPEDLQALRDTLGEAAVHVMPGAGSSLPAVLDCCSRRSRFTDKLVDLVSARFTEHDYERWGRLWWWRLGELAAKTGDRRADVDGLLSGRPSDLAKEAAKVETPPVPDEVAYVSARDFRLVRFAGYGLVVVEVPKGLDLHLTARVARERYDAPLALAFRPDSEFVVFSGDELSGRRSLDLAALVEHIANKLEWVEQLTDADHVARMRVRQLPSRPERLDEIVAEIAMGRSILER